LNELREEKKHLEAAVADWRAHAMMLLEEKERLKAAIATPEVYAGVVSKVVEQERDKLAAEYAKLLGFARTLHDSGYASSKWDEALGGLMDCVSARYDGSEPTEIDGETRAWEK
jgi:hypothetical protein